MSDFLRFDNWRDVRPEDWPLQYFSPEEVADSRDDSILLYVPFGLKMDQLRHDFGAPIRINSWYRTPAHDESIGGKGAHRGGWAADIAPANGNWNRLIYLAGQAGFLGFGDNEDSFIHLDDSQQFLNAGKRPAMWKY